VIVLASFRIMDWDWQHTIPSTGSADNGVRCLAAPLGKGDKVIGYMFSADATDKLTTVASQDVKTLKRYGKTLVLLSTAKSIDVVYNDTYLSTTPCKRVCGCWYYAPCKCCCENAEYELDEDDDTDTPLLPQGYSQKEDVVTRHTVEGPMVWVLGKFAR
jgi:hypothetical protein